MSKVTDNALLVMREYGIEPYEADVEYPDPPAIGEIEASESVYTTSLEDVFGDDPANLDDSLGGRGTWEAAWECRDLADAMVVCGFALDPQAGETTLNLVRLTELKARMSQELHAADAYKAGGGNLFVVFGEPDIALDQADGECLVRLRGVDIFDPTIGEVRSSGRVGDDVACWFVDTDYDGGSFFVRHAYFLGGKDPFEKLKTEVDEDAWASLYRTEGRLFVKPKSGRIAVKVINYYGDEAMRVFRL